MQYKIKENKKLRKNLKTTIGTKIYKKTKWHEVKSNRIGDLKNKPQPVTVHSCTKIILPNLF